MQVQNDRQIDPPFARPDIGDVACPLLVGLARGEVLLQEIRCDVELVVAVRSCLEFMSSDHRNGILPHQTTHPAVPDTHPQLVQFFRHPGPAIAAQTGPMLVADVRQQHHVTPLPVRYRAMFPCPQATIRDPHHTARTRLRKDAAIVLKERKLHGFWAAKN